MENDEERKHILKNSIIFIVLMGLVSALSDFTHEGAKSIYGNFLVLPEIGANSFVVSLVSGLGELLGCGLILVTGAIANKTKKYWLMTIIGYSIDIIVIPALALTFKNGWIYACSLILLERIGRSIRKPAKSTLVSFASKNAGEGKTFGWLEFLDQIGAFLGPLFLTFILLTQQGKALYDSYRFCFLMLIIPGILTLLLLLFAKFKFPHPENFEEERVVTNDKEETTKEKSKAILSSKDFIFYIIAICLVALGFIDFPLIEVYLQSIKVVDDNYLPLLYSLAMLSDAIAALAFGYAYDKIKIWTLVIATILSAAFPILIFSTTNFTLIIIGIILWGIGMGAEESILKSAVATLVSKNNRSLGYGIFEGFFGLFWFFGSALFGYLYSANWNLFIYLSFGLQILSLVFFALSIKAKKNMNNIKVIK